MKKIMSVPLLWWWRGEAEMWWSGSWTLKGKNDEGDDFVCVTRKGWRALDVDDDEDVDDAGDGGGGGGGGGGEWGKLVLTLSSLMRVTRWDLVSKIFLLSSSLL